MTIKDLLGLGLEPKDLTALHMSLRGLIVFIAALVMVRVGHKRFMSRMTAFDAVLGLILASTLSRAVNGSAAFIPTLVVGFVLVLLHRLISALAFYWKPFANLVKGNSDILIKNGEAIPKRMSAHKVSEERFPEEARLNGRVKELKEVALATIERNGKISVVPKD